MEYENLKEKILEKYIRFIEPVVGKNTQLGETLTSGLDGILREEFNLQGSAILEPRQVPAKFQLTIEELSNLELPNPNEVCNKKELNALYGGLGTKAFYSAARSSYEAGNTLKYGAGTTLKDMQIALIGYRKLKRKSPNSKFYYTGIKTALAMEDYLMMKAGYSTVIN